MNITCASIICAPCFSYKQREAKRLNTTIKYLKRKNQINTFDEKHTMDSINKQQPEENYRPLEGEAAVKKIKELADKAGTCFFCTNIITGKPFATRPMAVQKVDEEGNFWFLSANDSYKNRELQADPTVQMLFQGSSYSDFLQLYGKATISEDKGKIKALWNPMLKTWFTEGIDDPRISVICVEPTEGYYWDTKHNMAIALIKRAAGAIMGKTLDDSIEGELAVSKMKHLQ